jgi:hypothetical protein
MKRFKNILFFADGGTEPGPTLERAVTLARVLPSEKPVTVRIGV